MKIKIKSNQVGTQALAHIEGEWRPISRIFSGQPVQVEHDLKLAVTDALRKRGLTPEFVNP